MPASEFTEATYTWRGALIWLESRTNKYGYRSGRAKVLLAFWVVLWPVLFLLLLWSIKENFSDKFSIIEALFVFSLDIIFPGFSKSILRRALSSQVKDEMRYGNPLDIAESSAHLVLTITTLLIAFVWLISFFLNPGWTLRGCLRGWILVAVLAVVGVASFFFGLAFAWAAQFMRIDNYTNAVYIPWIFPDTVCAPMNYVRIFVGIFIFVALWLAHGRAGM